MKRRNLEEKIMALLQIEHLSTAPEIIKQLTGLDQTYNKTSVYRALDRLLDNGQLCRHDLGNRGVAYELRANHHEHLQCEQCGEITTLPCSFNQPASIAGFKISHHHLTYYGICSNCQ